MGKSSQISPQSVDPGIFRVNPKLGSSIKDRRRELCQGQYLMAPVSCPPTIFLIELSARNSGFIITGLPHSFGKQVSEAPRSGTKGKGVVGAFPGFEIERGLIDAIKIWIFPSYPRWTRNFYTPLDQIATPASQIQTQF